MKSAPGLSRLMQRKSFRLGNAFDSVPREPEEASGKPVAGMSNSSLRFDLIAVLFLFLFQRRDLTRAKKS